MKTIEWEDGAVLTVDQTKLPNQAVRLKLRTCTEVAEAIKGMQIRGAPLLGAAAAYGLALGAYHSRARDRRRLLEELASCAQTLKKTRPTAVNLFWAINRTMETASNAGGDATAIRRMVVEEAERIAAEDVAVNRRIGKHGSTLIDDGDTVLTHCNAGSLATVDYGTALGVIRAAWDAGKRIQTIATETRPLLQGARLTAYELLRDGIPVTLATDSMVGYLMSTGVVDKVVVGADRIVKDAVVNKIGTYTISVLAHEHKIPFLVAAPKSTFDLKHLATDVTIEQRSIDEVVKFRGVQVAPEGLSAYNPAFDLTPLRYVTAVICEDGVLSTTAFQKLSNG